MHVVQLTRDQLAYIIDRTDRTDRTDSDEYKLNINVVTNVEITKWLNNNLDDASYTVEDKHVDITSIYNKDEADPLTTLSISFVHLEDAIKFKLEN